MIPVAARAWLDGHNPYQVVGEDAYYFHHVLHYPPAAILVGVPFAGLSWYAATVLFVGLSVGLFTFAVWPSHRWAMLGLLSGAGIAAISFAQWTPILIGAALVPGFGFLLAAKPSTALALWIAYPAKQSAVLAGALSLVALMLFPTGIQEWLSNTSSATHLAPLITYPWGGPLMLLALRYWRQPEARLILALACVPRTPMLYDCLPLFLLARSLPQALTLFVGATIAWPIFRWTLVACETFDQRVLIGAYTEIWFLFVPALYLLLRQGAQSSFQLCVWADSNDRHERTLGLPLRAHGAKSLK